MAAFCEIPAKSERLATEVGDCSSNICASAQHEEGEPQLRSDKQPAGGWAGSHCRRLAPWSLLCRRNYLSTEQATGAVCFVLKSCRRLIIAAKRKRIKTSSRFCYGSFFLLVVGVCWKGMGVRSAGGRGLCWDQERCPEGDHSILSPLLSCCSLWHARGDLAALSLFTYVPTLPSPWGPVDHLCWVCVMPATLTPSCCLLEVCTPSLSDSNWCLF